MTYQAQRLRPLPEEERTNQNRLKWQPDPVSAVYARENGQLAMQARWEGGKVSEFYVRGGYLIFQGSLRFPSDIRIVEVHAGDRSAPDLSKGDFPEIPALRRADYVRTENIQGKKIYVFECSSADATGLTAQSKGLSEAATRALAEQTEAPAQQHVLWLDAKTLLPVQYRNKDFVYDYTLDKSASALSPTTEAFKKAVREVETKKTSKP
ncbi:MAG: hypothetical protein SFU85_12555 [Candidatus Methylacidiphilales bacterium]|nr:hypothetical protein [Candidatus Methylacidiphilales bacterium]